MYHVEKSILEILLRVCGVGACGVWGVMVVGGFFNLLSMSRVRYLIAIKWIICTHACMGIIRDVPLFK